ncbi:MAG: helix-turn-helix transcriptional regulator [Gammaproteobacteria bacterium]|nr:helix-turn-helix transcriptional regulator [Gammaproteobacteria bacterium]
MQSFRANDTDAPPRTSPFAHSPMLVTDDGDELRDFLSAKSLQIEYPGPVHGSSLLAVINAVYMPWGYFSFLRYGVPLEVIARGDRPDFSLSFPHVGSFELGVGRHVYQGGGLYATIGSPKHDQCTLLRERSSRFGISLAQGAVVRQLEALLGEALSQALEFHPLIDLDTPKGRVLKATIEYVCNVFDGCVDSSTSALFAAHAQELVIGQLLDSQPHNYSRLLQCKNPAPAPRAIRLAVEYLQAHAFQAVTLADLSRITRLPGRTLNEHFRKATGRSPLNYLRDVRMARARGLLLDPDNHRSVSDIAHACGFPHLGRFSVQYRRVYGESPSATRRRCATGPQPESAAVEDEFDG